MAGFKHQRPLDHPGEKRLGDLFILFVQDKIRSGLPLLASYSISHFCLSFKVQRTGWDSEYREVQLRKNMLQCGSRASILFFTSWEPVGMFDFAIFIVFQKLGFGHRNRCFPQASLWFFLVVPQGSLWFPLPHEIANLGPVLLGLFTMVTRAGTWSEVHSGFHRDLEVVKKRLLRWAGYVVISEPHCTKASP